MPPSPVFTKTLPVTATIYNSVQQSQKRVSPDDPSSSLAGHSENHALLPFHIHTHTLLYIYTQHVVNYLRQLLSAESSITSSRPTKFPRRVRFRSLSLSLSLSLYLHSRALQLTCIHILYIHTQREGSVGRECGTLTRINEVLTAVQILSIAMQIPGVNAHYPPKPDDDVVSSVRALLPRTYLYSVHTYIAHPRDLLHGCIDMRPLDRFHKPSASFICIYLGIYLSVCLYRYAGIRVHADRTDGNSSCSGRSGS